jgi:hypothetical protein
MNKKQLLKNGFKPPPFGGCLFLRLMHKYTAIPPGNVGFFGPPHYETTTGVKHVEYYDKGYLLGTSFGEDWGEYTKLIKTDINGYYLWDRTFDTLVFNSVKGISVSDDGSIYCVGNFRTECPHQPLGF